MRASEVDARVRADHAELREMLAEIETLSDGFEAGGEEVGRLLRDRGLALYERFELHLDLEDRLLKPLLAAAGLEGERGVRHLEREHREQRELIQYLLGRLTKRQNPTLLIARELRNFVEYLRLDMAYEESTMLVDAILEPAETN